MTFCVIKIILIFNRYEDLLKKNIQEIKSTLLNDRKISIKVKQLNVSFNETRSFVSCTNNHNRALLKFGINELLV